MSCIDKKRAYFVLLVPCRWSLAHDTNRWLGRAVDGSANRHPQLAWEFSVRKPVDSGAHFCEGGKTKLLRIIKRLRRKRRDDWKNHKKRTCKAAVPIRGRASWAEIPFLSPDLVDPRCEDKPAAKKRGERNSMNSQENAEKWTVRGPNCRVMLERLRAIQRNVSG